MKSTQNLLAIFFIVFLSFGCAQKYQLGRSEKVSDSSWPNYRGDLAARGKSQSTTFAGTMEQLWEQRISEKPTGPLTLFNECLVFPGSKKRLKFIDVQNGQVKGNIRSKGLSSMALSVSDTLAFYTIGGKRNQLVCVNLYSGKVVWRQAVKNAAPGSIIAEELLIVSSGDGFVRAFEITTGQQRWQYKGQDRFTAGPSYFDGIIYQPGDRGTLVALDALDGSERFQVKFDEPLVSSVAVSETGTVFTCDIKGNFFAFRGSDGEIVWRSKINGPVWASPSLSQELIFIGQSGGELIALEQSTGAIRWTYQTSEVIKASPLVHGGYVIVGTLGGSLLVVSQDTGLPISRYALVGAIGQSPISDGQRIFVATESGRVLCFGETHEQLGKADNGEQPQSQSQ